MGRSCPSSRASALRSLPPPTPHPCPPLLWFRAARLHPLAAAPSSWVLRWLLGRPGGHPRPKEGLRILRSRVQVSAGSQPAGALSGRPGPVPCGKVNDVAGRRTVEAEVAVVGGGISGLGDRVLAGRRARGGRRGAGGRRPGRGQGLDPEPGRDAGRHRARRVPEPRCRPGRAGRAPRAGRRRRRAAAGWCVDLVARPDAPDPAGQRLRHPRPGGAAAPLAPAVAGRRASRRSRLRAPAHPPG